MQGNVLGQAGGRIKINAIIEEYKVASGENVRTGDFVQYINEASNQQKQLSNSTDSGSCIQAVKISDNKVLILHSRDGNITNKTHYYYLYGIVCQIEGDTIITGIDTQICSTQTSAYSSSIVLLDNEKVFIAHSYTSWKLYGTVCTINGTSISAGKNTSINSSEYTAATITALKLSENKVVILHGTGGILSESSLTATICTIDGTTITKNSSTKLGETNTGDKISAIALKDNKVFIAHSYSISHYLHYTICEINNNEITVIASSSLSNLALSGYYQISITLLTDTKIVVVYGNNQKHLYGLICDINTDITELITGVDTRLSTELNTGIYQPAVKINNDEVSITHYLGKNYLLYNTICKIKGMEIIVENSIQLLDTSLLSGYGISAILLDNNYICISYGYNANNTNYPNLYLLCTSIKYGVQIIKSPLEEVLGVAKTKGREGQIVQVYIPKLSEYICTENENRIITENGEEIRNE